MTAVFRMTRWQRFVRRCRLLFRGYGFREPTLADMYRDVHSAKGGTLAKALAYCTPEDVWIAQQEARRVRYWQQVSKYISDVAHQGFVCGYSAALAEHELPTDYAQRQLGAALYVASGFDPDTVMEHHPEMEYEEREDEEAA